MPRRQELHRIETTTDANDSASHIIQTSYLECPECLGAGSFFESFDSYSLSGVRTLCEKCQGAGYIDCPPARGRFQGDSDAERSSVANRIVGVSPSSYSTHGATSAPFLQNRDEADEAPEYASYARTIPLSSGGFTIVDEADYAWLSRWKWHRHEGKYVRRANSANGKKGNLWMHRLLIDVPEGMQVDHINRNKVDNRRANLRIVTPAQNMRNLNANPRNTSGYTGVSWIKRAHKWSADTQVNGKHKFLGHFDTPEEASEAYEDFVGPLRLPGDSSDAICALCGQQIDMRIADWHSRCPESQSS